MRSTDTEQLAESIAAVAVAWREPDHPERERAVEQTLALESNTFTEEAVAFAINQQMALITARSLSRWIQGRRPRSRLTVGVLNAGNIPMVELQDFLAVVLTGHRYVGHVSSRSPALLPAFAADVSAHHGSLDAEFVTADELFKRVDAVIATGRDETAQWVHEQAAAHAIPEHRRLVRGHGFAVAVLDGEEADEDYEHLAEDALLHEGLGCRNVAIVWAPKDLAPDAFMDALARFRAVFPAHESTPRRLKMQQAFLAAVNAPHAYGEGLEFLISKGEPEAQQPGHIRWVEYSDVTDIRPWLDQHHHQVQLLTARPAVIEALRTGLHGSDHPFSIEPLGSAQRPPLGWCPGGIDTIEFLTQLQ